VGLDLSRIRTRNGNQAHFTEASDTLPVVAALAIYWLFALPVRRALVEEGVHSPEILAI